MDNYNEIIPVYFSHSYRPEDRELNRFFWDLFYQNGFRFTVDPKSETFSISYLELMMKQSACFAAVVTERMDQPKYRCSPYILSEYGLSVQAKKPGLVFVETGVRSSNFDEEGTCFFNRRKRGLDKDKFIEQIHLLKEKSFVYRDLDIKGRGTVGFIFGSGKNSENCYKSLIPKMKELFEGFGYDTEDINIDFENSLRFSLDLDHYDFVVISVDPDINPAWVYPFIYGRFIPSIRLLNLSATDLIQAPLSPLLTNYLIQGIGVSEDFILFWQEERELIGKLTEQLKKFDQTRTEFQTLEEGDSYFRSIGRETASVFISNANDANLFSQLLSKALSVENINHFQYKYQNDLTVGKEWQDGLLDEVRKCKVFIALITKGYLKSDWCQKEYKLALQLREENQLEFIPYFLDDVKNFYPPVQGTSVTDISDEERKDIIIKDLDEILQRIKEESPKELPVNAFTKIDIALITILPEEYKAVIDHLDKHAPAPSSTESRNLHAWEIGEIQSPNQKQPYRVVVAMAGIAGNTSGYQVTKDTVDRWKPRYVLLIGIAGGLPMESVKKGDVVISNMIWGYEYGKIENGFKPRHLYSFPTNTSLIVTAQAYAKINPSWTDALKTKAPEHVMPSVKIGIVGSGDKVIDNIDDPFVLSILKEEPKLLAIEMEGAGSAAAIKAIGEEGKSVGFTMIRGISDLPKSLLYAAEDGGIINQTEQRDAWKQYAADVAACFAVSLIRNRWTEPPFDS